MFFRKIEYNETCQNMPIIQRVSKLEQNKFSIITLFLKMKVRQYTYWQEVAAPHF